MPTPPAEKTHRHFQLLAFLLVFPAANSLFVATILYDLGVLNLDRIAWVILRLWSIFGLAFAGVRLLHRALPKVFHPDHFWRQLLAHLLLIIFAGALVGPVMTLPTALPRPDSMFMPRVVLALEIIVYLGVLRVLRQQAREFQAQATAREAELSMLRAQSNPHFLFNTLNLISSQIADDPDNAREIVFDLADLLRSNIKMAQQSVTTVAEELRLVSLYLTLQQKRFGSRLSFSVELASEAEALPVPSLLLQPVVENTVKYAVAPYATPAHVQVQAQLADDTLRITVRDTGPAFDDSQINVGNGFRILHQTLALHYGDDYDVTLNSTDAGGVFTLSVPASMSSTAYG
ncbi:MAG: histidine kinase [Pseudomonadota bacterium]